ncbi:phage tail protein [Lentilactobacillus kefiri]|uniref:phage tail protein n=1 Tax=Lentilactobacillus kefiri TaxID=33962 RepID=UPI00246875B9|nr:phage tail protein [Lentilactobacillus kefiri]MDH5107740.1 phage tail protein [Lentilactobacillus kefiri]
MSTHGIKDVTFGLVDATGKLLTSDAGVGTNGVYLVDGDAKGATTATVSGLEAAGTVAYANDEAKRVSNGQAQPEVALEFLDIDFDELQKLKGYIQDKVNGGWTRRLPKPHVAMLLHFRSYTNIDMYEGFANGQLIEPGSSHATDNNAETDANTALTYQALTPANNTIFNGEPYKIWMSQDAGFDKAKMLAEVFGGYSAPIGGKPLGH